MKTTPGGDNAVVPTSRTVMEHKLLTALEDKGTAAILVSKDDLTMLINALDAYMTVEAKRWSADLRQLRKEAFNE